MRNQPEEEMSRLNGYEFPEPKEGEEIEDPLYDSQRVSDTDYSR